MIARVSWSPLTTFLPARLPMRRSIWPSRPLRTTSAERIHMTASGGRGRVRWLAGPGGGRR